MFPPLPLELLQPISIAQASPGALVVVADSDAVSLYACCESKGGKWILALAGPNRYRVQFADHWTDVDYDRPGFQPAKSSFRLALGPATLTTGDPVLGSIRIGKGGPCMRSTTVPAQGGTPQSFWMELSGFAIPAGRGGSEPSAREVSFDSWQLSVIVDSQSYTIATGPGIAA